MKYQDAELPSTRWRPLTVDALIATTVLALAFATIKAADVDYVVLLIAASILLVGIGWVVEPLASTSPVKAFVRRLESSVRSRGASSGAALSAAPADTEGPPIEMVELATVPPFVRH